MAEYPDVLDHLGKTPREFGSVHVHAEPVRVDDGWGWTSLWFQAAFEPVDARATFSLVSSGDVARELCATQPVPPLGKGVVVKQVLRFRLMPEDSTVVVNVSSTVGAKATRVRQPWRLFDTIEIAKESQMRSAGNLEVDVRESIRASLIGAPFGQVTIAFTSDEGADLRDALKTTVHKARDLGEGLRIKVLRDPPMRPMGEGTAVVWTPGQPLPEPPKLAPVVPPPKKARQGTRRECRCGFSGKLADFEHDRFCPECGREWD